jgi:hypothetical protein
MASATHDLELFAKEALSRGLERPAIEQAMIAAGWTQEQARTAIGAYAQVPFPIPVPRPRPQLSAREAFLYLLLFTTLYLSCYHLGSLLFDLINRWIPDATETGRAQWIENSIRWSVSYLIVSFPAFAFLASYIGKEVASQPVKRLSPVRRWLTYLTLFIAAAALIGDLTTLVYNVLAGELTTRILLKVLIVILIAGTVFIHYLTDLRKEERD